MPKPENIYINGVWRASYSKITRTILNPTTGLNISQTSDCSIEDVNEAIHSARKVQKDWWKTPAVEKAKLLHEIASLIRSDAKELATLMTLETGKPLCESLDCIEWVTACFDYYAEIGRSNYGISIPPVAKHQFNFTIKEPYGVVAAIVPFNFPLLLMAWKIAPALMAGNTVVCKPPHQNPLSNLRMAKAYEVLPKGVIQVITGGSETGSLLASHHDIDLVAFTGSTDVGKKIIEQSSRGIKKVNLELGGIDPLIVFDDANLDVAVQGSLWARLLNCGQVCTSSKRIYVPESIAGDFGIEILKQIKTLRVGNPLEKETDIGPLISHEALLKVEEQVEKLQLEGAERLWGGKRIHQFNGGNFFEPTLFDRVKHGGVATTEEIFGPVVCIIRTKDNEEAIRMANDSKFGLGATIYTNNLERAMDAMENIKAGTFWINDPLTDNDGGAFGGMRMSGIGRELGPEGLDAFREVKHVHLDYRMEKKSSWFPYERRNHIE